MPTTLAWILIGLANSVEFLYISRILSGFTFGLAIVVMPTYLGEISSIPIRGRLVTFSMVMVKVGILLSYAIGPYVSMQTMAYLGVISPMLAAFLTIVFLPESPYFLLGENREDEALAVLKKLRQRDDVRVELDEIKVSVEINRKAKGTVREILYDYGNRKALWLILSLSSIQIICGSQVVIAYAQTIFDSFGSSLKANYSSMILGIIQVITAVLVISIVDRIGRRPLIFFGIIGTTLCNLTVGIFYLLQRYEYNLSQITWMPVAAVLTFVFFYVIGLSTIVFTILSELFKKNVKGLTNAMYTMHLACLSFLMIKLFEIVSFYLGKEVPFFVFGLLPFVFTPYVWFWLPETKGKSFDVISNELNSKKR